MSRIVMTTIGSLGDLHPKIALAIELRRRGHRVVLCTTEVYREKIGKLGFPFFPMRPNITIEDPAILSLIMDGRKGPEYLMRKVIFPNVRATYEDLSEAVAADGGADAIVSGELVYPAPLVAEKRGIPWVSSTVAPISLFSIYDFPVLPGMDRTAWMVRVSPLLNRQFLKVARFMTRDWSIPLAELRAELGLAPGKDPIYEGKYSPHLALAMFSPIFGPPQRDWPAKIVVAGFPFYDAEKEGYGIAPDLKAFLDAGAPPIVFTLGSAAVFSPGAFYEESVKASVALGRRAVLLIGQNAPPARLPANVIASPYAPYSAIFPHAAAIVHQGGIGTTSQALRAGKPMLVMPYSYDQFDNAARAARLGAGKTILRGNYNAKNAVRALRPLLENPEYLQKAEHIGEILRKENGVSAACDAIEKILGIKSQ